MLVFVSLRNRSNLFSQQSPILARPTVGFGIKCGVLEDKFWVAFGIVQLIPNKNRHLS